MNGGGRSSDLLRYPCYYRLIPPILTNVLSYLVIILLGIIVHNVEESELIYTLGSGDNSEPVSQLLLLEELLRPIQTCQHPSLFLRSGGLYKSSQVFKISSRELCVCNDLNLSIADLGNLDDITKVSDTAVDLDLVLEELLEGGDVEDLVAGRLRSVDDELGSDSKHGTLAISQGSHGGGSRIPSS